MSLSGDFDPPVTSLSINGPYIIGYTLCFGLMGALVVQAYIYFTRFTDDRRAIKTLVTIILLLEAVITAFIFPGLWTTSVQELFNAPSTIVSNPTVFAPIAGLVTTLTHAFYCWRISLLRKTRLIPILIMMVSLLQLITLIFFVAVANEPFPSVIVQVVPGDLVFAAGASLSPWLVIWLASSAICDLTITIFITLSLRPSKSNFASNRSSLVKLTRFTIETGLVTTIAALLELILAVVFREESYHAAVFYTISKLYANCLLASLNFRLVLRSQSNPNLTAIVWQEEASEAQSIRSTYQPSRPAQVVARVETDVDVVLDLNPTPGLRKNRFIEDLTLETYELGDRSGQV